MQFLIDKHILGEDLGKKHLKLGKMDFVTRQISLLIYNYSQLIA